MGNTIITIKKSYYVFSRVYTSIFRKNTKLSQYLDIEYVGILRCQEHEYDHKKSPSIVLRIYMSIFKFLFYVFFRNIDVYTLKSTSYEFFIAIFVFPMSENPIKPNFKVLGQIRIFSKNRRVGPQ